MFQFISALEVVPLNTQCDTDLQISGKELQSSLSRCVVSVDEKLFSSRTYASRLPTISRRQSLSSFKSLSEREPPSATAIRKHMFFKSTLS